MSLKNYVRLWLLLTIALAVEAYALNFNAFISVWAFLRENVGFFKSLSLSPIPGKTISLWYGWTGLTLMILTNPYILRKHWGVLKKIGQLPGWLDFHIFCGLLGPTFILFHTNFKIGGLVAISFWSMVVSFGSGVVGRYFYLQLVRQKNDLEHDATEYEKAIQSGQIAATQMDATALKDLQSQAILLAGGTSGEHEQTGIFKAVAMSFVGDIRLKMGIGKISHQLSPSGREALKDFAKTKRRISFLSQFQQVMGYWHSFHMPFAVFMYLVAVIHVTVALLLQVKH